MTGRLGIRWWSIAGYVSGEPHSEAIASSEGRAVNHPAFEKLTKSNFCVRGAGGCVMQAMPHIDAAISEGAFAGGS